jgi:hypothetical protein
MKVAVALAALTFLLVSGPSAQCQELLLTTHRFDPGRGEPPIPDRLRADEPEPGTLGYYLIQLAGPVHEDHTRSLRGAGAELLGYVPHYGFLVRMSPETASAVAAAEEVRWVGLYHPAYKLSPWIGTNEFKHPDRVTDPWFWLVVRVHDTEDVRPVAQAISSLGGEVLDLVMSGNRRVLARVPPELLEEVARIQAVLYVTERGEYFLTNNTTRWVVQTNASQDTSIWAHGIHGEGQLVAVLDTGTDHETCFFRDPEGDPFGDDHRKIQHYSTWGGGNPYDGCDSGHGTHTAGTVLGNDYTATADAYNGMAYNARLIVQDAGVDDFWACFLYLFSPPTSLTGAFQDAYDRGARVHSNSWGWSWNHYGDYAEDVDGFMWDNPDFVLCFAAGNYGPLPETIVHPANAKNCVSVGATEQAGTQNNLAGFSSHGPVYDGRRKPTVCAPGQGTGGTPPHIWSADNDINSVPTCATESMAGTSMSTPAVAGCAALIRQYFTDGFWPSGAANIQDAFNPSAALVKAVLVASGERMTGSWCEGYPDNSQGWGRVLLEKALHFAGDDVVLDLEDHAAGISTGVAYSKQFLLGSSYPARFVLVWTDPPKTPPADPALVNNLNLRVTDPGGTSFWGSVFDSSAGQSIPGGSPDSLNVVEVVHRDSPPAGWWTAEVIGQNVPQGPQPFALVVTGDGSSPMTLWGDLSGGQLVLQWTACVGANAYWVHGADNHAHFEPDTGNRLAILPPGTTTWSISNGVGDPDHNWTYVVVAVDSGDQEMCRSNRFGEHDFSLGPGP